MDVKPLLEINNLTIKNEQQELVQAIDLQIKSGKSLALLGPSGSGKTLTALAIPQLLPHGLTVDSNSRIIFEGKDLLDYNEHDLQEVRGKKIAMIFQEPALALNPVMTVGQQIAESVKRSVKVSKKKCQQIVIDWLQQVEIDHPQQRFYQYPHQLSGGMRQRVMLAIALAAKPKLLIADEPTSALDMATAAQLLILLRKLQQKMHMAMLFITHDLRIAKKIADDVMEIRQGRIIKYNAVNNFFTGPSARPILQQNSITAEALITKPVLSLLGVSVSFPVQKGIFKRTVEEIQAVNNVSFVIYPGETLALVGESGSGKTTLARAILRLIKINKGQIFFLDQEFTKINFRNINKMRRNLQIVFQDPYVSLDPRMLIGDILAEGLIAQQLISSVSEKEKHINHLLDMVGLPVMAKFRYPHEFSGGQRQRVVIARALSLTPKFIICDEPTSALDIETQQQIIELLKQLQKDFKMSYLFITHNIPLAAEISHRMAIMQHGKIIEMNNTNEILQQPQHDYTKTLLEASELFS